MKQFKPYPSSLLKAMQRQIAKLTGKKPSKRAISAMFVFHINHDCKGYHGYATGKTYQTAVPFDACSYCPVKNACYKKMQHDVRTALPELTKAWTDTAVHKGMSARRAAFARYAGIALTLDEYMVAINVTEGLNGDAPGTAFREALKHKHGWEA